MYYYKKLDEKGNVLGYRIIDCPQPESKTLIRINEIEVKRIQEAKQIREAKTAEYVKWEAGMFA